MQQSRTWTILIIVALALTIGHEPITDVLVDWLWFDALGFKELFTVTLGTKVGLWVGAFLVSAVFIGLNVRAAAGSSPINYLRVSALMGDQSIPPGQLRSVVRWLALAWIVLPSLLMAGSAASMWLDLLTFLESTPFGKVDPVFERDIGFYVFQLPLLRYTQDAVSGLLVLTLFPLAAFYVLRDLSGGQSRIQLPPFARAHLLGLSAMLFLSAAWGWWLDRYELLFDRHGVVWGMGYADLNAALPAASVMAVLSVGVALAMLGAVRQDGWSRATTGVGAYLIAQLLLVGAWPRVVEEYFVKPSELSVEREYLERNIAGTRAAYALDRIEVRPFEAATGLTMADVEANPLTLENVRVWDDRPLLETYQQIQEIRLYYEFADVDIDRYTIDGRLRQVMLSGRELSYASVPTQARSWVNEHFQYTHGYGLTLSPVNVVTPEGLPDLWVQDLPPTSKVDLPITRPEIYYGELSHTWVLVDTGAKELDYPLGDENVYTTYAGAGGVGIGSFARKLLFSLHFDSFDILLSQYLEPQSKVLMRRQIRERVRTLVPFLRYDQDPYMVVADGGLFWIIDAYTTTDRYPYSEPTAIDRLSRFNYMRNSVKVVVDAYNGTVRYYVADTEDPLIRAYQGIFPDTFTPMDQLPEGLRSHVRYPVDFFDHQARIYQAYHMTDPTVFYNKEDMWEFPKELYGDKEQAMQAYYLIMKLPDAESAEFILLLPFVPTNKDNMISWLAARCDPEVYGRLVLYQFPKQKLVYGPRQLEARIDQDPDISQQITLWSQSGSRVVRGNLLVIPIQDSLMYVEPLYLKAESGQLPELKRVIVSYNNRIAMRDTLDDALAAVFDPAPRPAVDEGAEPSDATAEGAPSAAPRVWGSLAAQANDAYQRAVDLQKQGDWAGYGQALGELGVLLEQLVGEAEGDGTPEEEADTAPPAQ
ncbi:MAG: UPF0182 family protein [Alphaproteobacteria bacterium]|nr:UPF0182 family protein [Alphaproteobacteria bacterium]